MLLFLSQSSWRLHKLDSFQIIINWKLCPRAHIMFFNHLRTFSSGCETRASLKLTHLHLIPTQTCMVQTLSPLWTVSLYRSAPTMLVYLLMYCSNSNLNTLLKSDPGSKGPDFIIPFISEVNTWYIISFRTSQQPLERRGILYKQLTTLNMSSLLQLSEITTYI